METTLIAQTQSKNYRLLDVGGQLAVSAYHLLARHLRNKLSPAHADLLAEPHFNAERGSIDWVSAGQGPIRRLGELDAARRATAIQQLGQLVSDIRVQIGSLRKSASEGDRLIGELLSVALEIPSREQVYLVGEQPVLIAWGHQQQGAEAGENVLTRITRAQRPAPPLIEPPAPFAARGPRGARWTPALLSVALLGGMAALLWQYWQPLQARLQLPAPQCRIAPENLLVVQAIDIEKRREFELTRDRNAAWAALAAKRRDCQPIIRKTAALDPPPPDVARVIALGGRGGQAQVILAWDNINDLDLQIVCPDKNARISLGQPKACGGEFDIESNRKRIVTDAAENIVWDQKPPAGIYRIAVIHAGRVAGQGTATASSFRVTVRIAGQPDKQVTGRIDAGRRDEKVAEFTIE